MNVNYQLRDSRKHDFPFCISSRIKQANSLQIYINTRLPCFFEDAYNKVWKVSNNFIFLLGNLFVALFLVRNYEIKLVCQFLWSNIWNSFPGDGLDLRLRGLNFNEK